MPDAIEEHDSGIIRLLVPKVGENVDDSYVEEVIAQPGTNIRAGEDLIVLETAKANVVITSPATGLVSHVHVSEGDTVYPQDAICDIEP